MLAQNYGPQILGSSLWFRLKINILRASSGLAGQVAKEKKSQLPPPRPPTLWHQRHELARADSLISKPSVKRVSNLS